MIGTRMIALLYPLSGLNDDEGKSWPLFLLIGPVSSCAARLSTFVMFAVVVVVVVVVVAKCDVCVCLCMGYKLLN